MPVSFHAPRRLLTAAALAGAIAGGLSCGGDSHSSSISIGNYIASITDQAGTVTAVRHTGDPPAATGGATVNVSGIGTVINGGSAQVTVSTPSGSFTDIFIVVEGVEGFYQLTLANPVTTEDLLVTLAQHIPEQQFDLTWGIGSTGAVGGYQTVPVQLVSVGSGDVQVSVSWNAESDVDLHVVEPGGEEIYYGHTSSATGGTLDLDSNAACNIDHVKNENITYANPPSGSFTVLVDYYDGCNVAQTDYVVTVQRKGHSPETFTGSFTGGGDQGSAGSGTQITTFAYP